MTGASDVAERRKKQQTKIRIMLNSLKAGEMASMKGGEDTVAWVKEELCIGCDQCTIVCDDDAIEMYKVAMRSPLINVESNQKAKIIRDACTGCRLCVLACPTDAISMIDR